ncbi:MAG TPA: hypothetical protein VHX68_04925 [Planctomycetaceae bacterium]|nr:hypothetical protein [Planctomycetaceae bacterium]
MTSPSLGIGAIETIDAFRGSESPEGLYFQLRKTGKLTTTRYFT